MVKRLQHSIDQAIQTVIDDVPANEITNWCENIRTSQVGQSMVGEMVDLPIGTKEISCTKVDSRMGGMTYKGAAEFFVESNCVDCPYHVLVGSPNIGQGIVDEVRKRLKVQEVDEQAQEELRKLVVPGIDVDAILAGDAETDEHVRSLVGLLADDERKADAAAKLVTVSEQFPQLISPSVAEVMTGAFSDRQIGGSVIQAISNIVDIKPSIWPRVIDAAKLALSSFSNAEQIGTIIDRALADGLLEPSQELAALLVDHLDPPVSPFYMFMGGGKINRPSIGKAYERVATMNYSAAAEAARLAIVGPESFRLSRGAAAVIHLIEVDGQRASLGFLEPLIEGLHQQDDEGDVDASLLKALEACISVNGTQVSKIIFDSLKEIDTEVGELIIRAFRFPKDIDDSGIEWLPSFLSLVNDKALPLDIRSRVSDSIRMLARDSASALQPHLDIVLGVLAQACIEWDEVKSSRPKDDQSITTLEFMEYQGKVSQLSMIERVLRETVVELGNLSPEETIENVKKILSSLESSTGATLKGALIRTLGEFGQWTKTHAPELVPVIYPHLLDPTSPHVRAAAAEACKDLTQWNRDLLPEDVVVVLASLLHDEWLHPVVSSTVSAFERVRVADVSLGHQVMTQLVSLAHAYGLDPNQHYLLRSLAWSVVNIANQHEFLAPVAAVVLNRMSQNNYYYTASDSLEHYGRFVKRRELLQSDYIERLINHYRRFNLEIKMSGSISVTGSEDSSFESLYYLQAKIVRAHTEGLTQLAVESSSEQNIFHVATLLLTLGLNSEASDLFTAHAQCLPQEQRADWRRERSLGMACLLQAEAALLYEDRSEAIDRLKEAKERFSAASHQPPGGLPFGLGKEESEPPFYRKWVDLRLEWLELAKQSMADIQKRAHELTERCSPLLHRDIGQRERQVLSISSEILHSIEFVARWRDQILAGDPASVASKDAALGRLAEARKLAVTLERWDSAGDLVSRIDLLLDDVAVLGPTSDLVPVVTKLTNLPLPVPPFQLPVPKEQSINRMPQDWNLDGENQQEPTSSSVGVASIQIDGNSRDDVFLAIANQLYDAKVELQISDPPEGASNLEVRPVSSLEENDYEFPRGTTGLEQVNREYSFNGHMKFPNPQSEGSQPLAVKVSASFIKDDGSRIPITLLGRPEIRVIVRKDVSHFRARGPAAEDAANKLKTKITELVPFSDDPNRFDEEEVAEALADYMDFQLKEVLFRGQESEADFESSLLGFLKIRFLERDDVYHQVWSGNGRIDGLVLGVPVELKIIKNGDLEKVVEDSLPQATQYIVTQGRRAGFLVILDLRKHTTPTPTICDDVSVRLGQTGEGFDPSPLGETAVGICIVRAHLTVPSALKPS